MASSSSLLVFKRLIREYAVALSATLLLICILVGMLMSRYYALAGLGDLSKINPLMSAGKSQLVGRDKTVGVTSDQQTNDGSSSVGNTPGPSQQSSPGSASTSQNSTSSSGQSGRSAPSSSSSSTNTQSSSPVPQFAVSVGAMTHVAGSPSGALGGLNPVCTITHQFTAAIHAVNGPGTMGYIWTQSNGATSATQHKDFASGTSDDQVSYQWTITAASGDYWVKLSVSSPNQTDKTLNFKHQCIL